MAQDQERKEIQFIADSLGMTTEEYLFYLHRKKSALKTAFQNDSTRFRRFLEDFYKIIDDLVHSRSKIQIPESSIAASLDGSIKMMRNIGSDPMILAMLYEYYEYDPNKPLNTLLNVEMIFKKPSSD